MAQWEEDSQVKHGEDCIILYVQCVNHPEIIESAAVGCMLGLDSGLLG